MQIANLRQKIAVERDARAMLDVNGLPQPDEVQYGHTCIRLLWYETKVVMIVDIDDPPSRTQFDGEAEEVIDRGRKRPRELPRAEPPA